MYFEVLILVLQEDYVDKQHVHYLSVNQDDDLIFLSTSVVNNQ